MNHMPDFVPLVRQVIPREGLSLTGTKSNRVKSKIRKLLNKNGYQTETLRGIGLKIGEYYLVYEITDTEIKASFTDQMVTVAKTRKTRSRKTKADPVMTGVHLEAQGMTLDEYTSGIIDHFPGDWQKVNSEIYRWISTDVEFLMNTQHTVESAASHIIGLSAMLNHQPKIFYTVIDIFGHIIIGVGPV